MTTWKKYIIAFLPRDGNGGTPVPEGARVTEADDVRVTEAGDTRVIE